MQETNQGTVGLRSWVAEMAAKPHVKAIAIGVTAVALTPVVLPVVKPVLKATIKSGVTLFEKTKGAFAETGEMLADIAAEARAEAQAEAQKKATLQATLSAPKSATPGE
jgi:hypothetical protein